MGLNVVERAIAHVGGKPTELARRLSEVAGVEITRQRIHGCRLRGVFSRDMIVAVHELTGIPIDELATAQPIKRDDGIVQRAIRLGCQRAGLEQSAANFAKLLSKSAGRPITRRAVGEWMVREQIPAEHSGWVHLLTGIPVLELLASKKKRWN